MDVTDLIRLHRAQLQGLVELRGVNRLRKIYEDSRVDLMARLRSVQRAGKADSFTAQHLRLVLAQVEDGLRSFGMLFAKQLRDNGRLSSALAARHLIANIKKFEQKFSGITPVIQTEQAMVFRGVYKGVEPSLLDRYRKSVMLYTQPTIEGIKEGLARSLVQNETVDEAVDRVVASDGIFDGQRWRAERIVRTETAYSYGVTKQRTMEQLRDRDVPDLMKRLVATWDERTGEDSKVLDGQTVPVDQPFLWNSPKGPVYYMAPPNRPNDREIVLPWRAGWNTNVLPDEAGPVTPVNPES